MSAFILIRLKAARPQLALLVLALLVNVFVAPGFLDLRLQDGRLFGGLIDILNRGAPVMLLAVGMAPVIATRGIDLSVGVIMAISGAVAAAGVNAGLAWPLAILAALATGLVCGLWNGLLVAVFRLQPIVATLILMVAGRGIAQLITEGRILTFTEPHLIAVAGATLAALPLPVVLALAAAGLTGLLVRATALGLFVEAVGTNPRSSRLAGVHTSLVLGAVYVWSGLMAALAGLIATADIKGADANNAGLWLELDAILAVVIGGTSLYGGRFSIGRSVLGALVLQAMRTAILRAGLPPELNLVLMALVVAAVLTQQSPAFRPLAQSLLARFKNKEAQA
ncbi:ABC transporter permease [Nitrospirillum amazonense]|uniref:ABC transporter permease n=1 Tax=Nitrospirillum amazonense TaxID=28077 RepID=UPI002412A781|nr:ABC transporter permease [Nitrospirillum amazonense]MDG3444176.1 ABC transporter permease [Nitrospirillum amazonense]